MGAAPEIGHGARFRAALSEMPRHAPEIGQARGGARNAWPKLPE
jgi:hypothetical protein